MLLEFGIALGRGANHRQSERSGRATPLKSREWPTGNTADSCRMYAEMMALLRPRGPDRTDGLSYDPDKGVTFTNKGDRAGQVQPRQRR